MPTHYGARKMLGRAKAKPAAGHKGARSKTRDAAGNFHEDYVTHKGDKDFDRDGHRSTHRQGSTTKSHPFSKKTTTRIKHVVKPMHHAPFEDAAERRARGERTHAKRKPRAGHKGAMSKTKDAAGNRHEDFVTHKGDKDYDRDGHRSTHRQGSTTKSKPFKSVEAAQKVIDSLKGKTKGDAEKLRKLRRAVAFKNAHHRFGKK